MPSSASSTSLNVSVLAAKYADSASVSPVIGRRRRARRLGHQILGPDTRLNRLRGRALLGHLRDGLLGKDAPRSRRHRRSRAHKKPEEMICS
jgi:hypothetical protein